MAASSSITSFLLKRYLLPREGNLLSFVLWISVVGVGLGIGVLILVLGVMSGFQSFLEERYTRITSHIIVMPRHSHEKDFDFEGQLQKTEGIKAYSPFLMGQGMLFAQGVGGAVLEGIDPVSLNKLVPLKEIFFDLPDPEVQKNTPHWIWLGKGLAEKLKVKKGEEVNVMVGEGKEGTIPFTVTGITKFGIYDHDLRYAYVSLPLLRKYFKRENDKPMYKIRLEDGVPLEKVADELKASVGLNASIKRWSDLNQNIFLAVAHQKRMLFVVLEIIVALAGVNVINLLMMSSHYRKRDTAILRAMGMRVKSIVFFFVAQGASVGAVGVILGVGMGLLFCKLVEVFQPEILSESVYNITKLPIKVVPSDLVVICAVAFILCVVFSVVPALKAAKERPVESLRVD